MCERGLPDEKTIAKEWKIVKKFIGEISNRLTLRKVTTRNYDLFSQNRVLEKSRQLTLRIKIPTRSKCRHISCKRRQLQILTIYYVRCQFWATNIRKIDFGGRVCSGVSSLHILFSQYLTYFIYLFFDQIKVEYFSAVDLVCLFEKNKLICFVWKKNK